MQVCTTTQRSTWRGLCASSPRRSTSSRTRRCCRRRSRSRSCRPPCSSRARSASTASPSSPPGPRPREAAPLTGTGNATMATCATETLIGCSELGNKVFLVRIQGDEGSLNCVECALKENHCIKTGSCVQTSAKKEKFGPGSRSEDALVLNRLLLPLFGET